MIHFVFWRKFRVEIPPPPPPIAMLKADENFIDELTSMSSFSSQHCNRPFSYSTKEPGSSDIFIQFYTPGSIEWR